MSEETIAAIATPPGKGGVGMVRISGPKACHIATKILGKIPSPRKVCFTPFYDPNGNIIDTGLAIYFCGPHSYTGEDVIELHGHGGPLIMDILLGTALHHGAILAKPGEFSQRAYLNGKMDLTQCEAVADLINASTQQAALSASRSLQGAFSEQISTLSNAIIELRVYVEAAIDFPEEEVDFLEEGAVLAKIEDILERLNNLQEGAKRGQILAEGLYVVLAGLPNAGKSSLLNALTQQNTAIVTPIPGTTRDIIKASIQFEGYPIHLVDTAGIRSNADTIEKEGIKRAKEQLALADRVLLIKEAKSHFLEEETKILNDFGHKTTLVMNKVDILGGPFGELNGQIHLSAKTGEGIKALLTHLKTCMGLTNSESGAFISRRRHLEALKKALVHCKEAHFQLLHFKRGELVAQELYYGHQALGEIVGKVSNDDMLFKIFSQFCIGK